AKADVTNIRPFAGRVAVKIQKSGMSVIIQVHVLSQAPIHTVARTVAQKVIARPALDPRNTNPGVGVRNRTWIAGAGATPAYASAWCGVSGFAQRRIPRRQAAVKLVAVRPITGVVQDLNSARTTVIDLGEIMPSQLPTTTV